MSKHLKLTAGIVSFLLVSGCATLTDGFYQKISVDSNAAGAYCTVRQDDRGLVDAVVAPGKLLVRHDRAASLHVTCSKAGYAEATLVVPTMLPGDQYPEKTAASLGSALATAGVSAFFDHSSGAGTWYPDSIFVWLEKE